jgi:solute:Na+ symporter, SSS family
MSPILFVSVVIVYFSILIFISWLTSRKSDTASFFTANHKSPWYLVAFGMIGATLSGATFISVPGEVGISGWGYFQIVLGYPLGYAFIIMVLLPVYYKLNLVSIYGYLQKRFGYFTYKTGSGLFMVSKLIGASFRLFLVTMVLQLGFFDAMGIPFEVAVLVTIALIYVYTYKAGIKTIVWTDTFQTVFMLGAVVLCIVLVGKELDINFGETVDTIRNHEFTKIFDWDWRSRGYFFKQFFTGIFMTIVMTGIDQDMIQKNLTCRNLKDARKNMFWLSLSLVPVNLLFLSVGVMLYVFASAKGIPLPAAGHSDQLFPILALNHFGTFLSVFFVLGIIAAAFSSADSALTALTTAFCIDFLNLDITKNDSSVRKTKTYAHIGFALLMFLTIVIFSKIKNESLIISVFKAASYTYGPLLGIFAIGLFSKLSVNDKWIPAIAIISPIISYAINLYSEQWFGGYKFGFEILIGHFLFWVDTFIQNLFLCL